MIYAAARVNLHVQDRAVNTFADIQQSWKQDGSWPNVARVYEICYGDYEGSSKQYWSRMLEETYMRNQNIAYDTETRLRDKGCYEKCITKAKGNLVKQIMDKSANTHMKKVVLSLKGTKNLPENWSVKFQAARDVVAQGYKSSVKQDRRKKGVFFLKEKVSILIIHNWRIAIVRHMSALTTPILIIDASPSL